MANISNLRAEKVKALWSASWPKAGLDDIILEVVLGSSWHLDNHDSSPELFLCCRIIKLKYTLQKDLIIQDCKVGAVDNTNRLE